MITSTHSKFQPSLEKLKRSLEAPNTPPQNQQPSQRQQACIITLFRVLDNILSDPQRNNPKVRKIKVDNPAFWKRAGQWDGGIDFLLACGFTSIGVSSQGNGKEVPQHLKLGGEDEVKWQVLMDGRESLVQFALKVLGMNDKSLPACPTESKLSVEKKLLVTKPLSKEGPMIDSKNSPDINGSSAASNLNESISQLSKAAGIEQKPPPADSISLPNTKFSKEESTNKYENRVHLNTANKNAKPQSSVLDSIVTDALNPLVKNPPTTNQSSTEFVESTKNLPSQNGVLNSIVTEALNPSIVKKMDERKEIAARSSFSTKGMNKGETNNSLENSNNNKPQQSILDSIVTDALDSSALVANSKDAGNVAIKRPGQSSAGSFWGSALTTAPPGRLDILNNEQALEKNGKKTLPEADEKVESPLVPPKPGSKSSVSSKLMVSKTAKPSEHKVSSARPSSKISTDGLNGQMVLETKQSTFPVPSKSNELPDNKPEHDEMDGLLEEIYFELNSGNDETELPSDDSAFEAGEAKETATDTSSTKGSSSIEMGLDGMNFVPTDGAAPADQNDEQQTIEQENESENVCDDLSAPSPLRNRVRLEQNLGNGNQKREDRDSTEKTDGITPNANDDCSYVSDVVQDLVDPLGQGESSLFTSTNPAKVQTNGSTNTANQQNGTHVISVDSRHGGMENNEKNSKSPGIDFNDVANAVLEKDIGSLLDDLESEANSTPKIVNLTNGPQHEETTSENTAHNEVHKTNDRPENRGKENDSATCNSPLNRVEDPKLDRQKQDVSEWTGTPKSYTELFRKIQLPEDEFSSSDGEEAKTFRLGFELCHRALFSIWGSLDDTAHVDNLSLKRDSDLTPRNSQATSGLANLNRWNDFVGDESRNHSPKNGSSQHHNHFTTNGLDEKEAEPVVLVPMPFVYTAWACILGLNSFDLHSDNRNTESGIHSGTMYAWLISNQPQLANMENVLSSSLSVRGNLTEASISVCNYVANSLCNIGLINLYGADVVGVSVTPSMELSLFVGIPKRVYEMCMDYESSIIIDSPLIAECHSALARTIYQTLLDELADGSSHHPDISFGGNQVLVWYASRHLIQHLLESKRLDDAQELLLNSRFIRARLHSMGLLRGTAIHSRECSDVSSCLVDSLQEWQSKELQAAHESDKKNYGVLSFSPEDYGTQALKLSKAPDIAKWRECHFKALSTISTVLHERVGELSMQNNDASTEGGQHRKRFLKEELGNALHLIGESIGDLGAHRVQEMEHYEEALSVKSEAFGDNQNHESIAHTLYAMGCHHQRFNNTTFANKCYEQALRIYKMTLGNDHLCVAKVLHNIGIMYAWKKENNVAMKCFKKSLAIRTAELGENDLSVADSMCWIGKTHREKKQYVEARECFLIAHQTKSSILGENHLESAEILHNIGVVCDDLGLFSQSLSCYKEAMIIRKANISSAYDVMGIHDMCETLNCIANVYRRIGERSRALQFFEQSLKRRSRIVSVSVQDKDQVALLLQTYEDVIGLTKLEIKESSEKDPMMLGKIGCLLMEMGKLYDSKLGKQSKALLYFQRSLQVFKELKSYKKIGDVLSYMGIVHVKMSCSEKALKCFNDSLVMRKLYSKEATFDTAETLHNIGNCEAKMGNFKKGLEFYEEALQIKRRLTPDGNSISIAKTEHCIGLALLQLKNLDDAMEMFMSSLTVRQKLLGGDHLDVSFSMHNIGRIYFYQEKIGTAIEILEKALEIKKAKLRKNHTSLAETEHLLGSLYVKTDKLDAAINLLKSALSTYKGTQDCEVMKSDVYDLLGSAHTKLGNNQEAIESYERSLAIKQTILGMDNIACANVSMEIGKLKSIVIDIDGALKAFKEVKRIQKPIYGRNHLKNAVLLIEVGKIQELLGNNDMAFKCFNEALRIRRKRLDENHADVAEVLLHIGRMHQVIHDHFNSISYFQDAIKVYCNLDDDVTIKDRSNAFHLLGISQMVIGDHQNALSSLEKCLQLQESMCGWESEEWADIAYDLATAEIEVGLHNDAIMLLEKFVILRKRSKDDDPERMSNALFQLGKIHSKQRNFDEALSVLDEALRIRKELEDNEIGVSEVLFHIGGIRESKKQYLESLVCYEESLKLRQSVYGEDETTADTMLRIGEVYHIRQQYDRALDSLAGALEMYKGTVGEDHLSVANTLHSLGYVYDAKNDVKEAMNYHKEGLKVRKLNLGKNHVKVADSLDDIARIYQKVGENENALRCLKEALRIRKLQLGEDSMDIATTLFGMGIIYAAISDNDAAMECYHSSLDISSRDGTNAKLEAQTLHQIGCVHAAICNYREALQNWRTSLSKYREAGFNDDHYMVACTLGNIEMAENVLAGN